MREVFGIENGIPPIERSLADGAGCWRHPRGGKRNATFARACRCFETSYTRTLANAENAEEAYYSHSGKQATMPERTKSPKERRITITRQAWHYWYDPIDLSTKILSAQRLRDKMHFGMAEYTDDGDEFWNSRAWGSSAMTTSGQFARTVEGEVIIPGDVGDLQSLGRLFQGSSDLYWP